MSNLPQPSEFQSLVLQNLVHSEQFSRKVFPHLKPDYFEGFYKHVFEVYAGFLAKYNKIPTQAALSIDFGNSEFAQKQEAQLSLDFISKVLTVAPPKTDADWLSDKTEKWCQDRAVFLAIMESIAIMDGQRKELNTSAIPSLLTKALSVSFDSHIGHDYIEQWDDRYNLYHTQEEHIPFDLAKLNEITRGGIIRKTLNCILAGTGVGKSLAMCHMGAAYLSQGRNVLYITLEMAEHKIAERIDANLLDIQIDQLATLPKTVFDSKINKLKAKTNGKLIVKEYPTASAHAGHFRALLNELRLKKNFTPDIIFIDYLNIAASSRMKGLGGAINSYSYVKAIAEEVRGLAVEFNVGIWTATQTNREGYSNSDVELTNTAESFGLPATVDLMLALISDEKLEQMNQILVKQLKNRYNDVTSNRKFLLGIDKSKMRLYDVSGSAQLTSSPPVGQTSVPKFAQTKTSVKQMTSTTLKNLG